MIEIKEIKASETWPLRFKVMYPDASIDFVKLPNDDKGMHFGLYLENDLVSVVSLFINDNVAQFRKLATKDSLQGNGYGSRLLNYIFNYCNELKCTKIWCNARVDKSSFYRKLGMRESNNNFQKNGLSYVIMDKEL